MEIILLSEAIKHKKYWKKSGNVKVQNRITNLIKSILETPKELSRIKDILTPS